MFSTVPVKKVARVLRMQLNGEEAVAVQTDAILGTVVSSLNDPKNGLLGYLKTNRTVCKSEWAYEVCIVFDGLVNFKGFMESDIHETTVVPKLREMQELSKPNTFYTGVRVYDDI